ncbi:anti-sigma factor domain-containing protein [Sporosarcina sp. UB5]|uniref:anti-sigma factor domain-containing protein n=1 Tax=Sporosarcina sp. UB5 TaxID=3047463 RepID=UPI003D7AFC5B
MMRTNRGIVCEKKNNYMVFLTEKGEFVRGVPIGDPPEVGEEAYFRPVASPFIAGRKAKPKFVAAVLVAVALLFFIVSSWSPMNEKVMAYVQLDGDTAMEFGVDGKGNVISLRYLNETANMPNHLSEWKDHPIRDVLDMAILKSSVPDKGIVITTIYPNRDSEPKTSQMIGAAVQEVRGKHDELNLQIAESTPEERKVANKQKMSIHQFKSTKDEKSFNEKQPAGKRNPIEEKPVQEQKDDLQKPKKEIVPTTPSQEKRTEKERLNKSEQEQKLPAEKIEQKPNDRRSESVPPHADKKGPPPHSPAFDQQHRENQGPPSKQEKEHPSESAK